jgi:FkbM family methyltransferase
MPSLKRLLVPAATRRMVRRRLEHRRRVGFYRQLVQPGGLVFDVGANRGDRVALFLAVPARVVAVEPQSSCHPLLHERFGAHPGFTLVRSALGARPGEADLMAANDHETSVLATLSRDWASSVRESGRFARVEWDRTERVEVTTLDALIDMYGAPQFCKIDVEGYELAVLEGLSTPIRSLSIEFTPERMEDTHACVARLLEIGDYELNYSLNESLVFASERWLSSADLIAALGAFMDDRVTFGDVYARLAA